MKPDPRTLDNAYLVAHHRAASMARSHAARAAIIGEWFALTRMAETERDCLTLLADSLEVSRFCADVWREMNRGSK